MAVDAGLGSAYPPRWLGWAIVALGLLILYVPTFYELAQWAWQQEDYAHGPVVLGVVAWLIWRQRRNLIGADASNPAPTLGIVLVAVGLLAYVIGRSQTVILFELGALVPILAGAVLAMSGARVLGSIGFPIFFVLFAIPLPGIIIDTLTGPLKGWVSAISTNILYAAGYPVARDGVVITIGGYELLVADACSGLNSMFSLSALGLLLMYLMARKSVVHNALVLIAILPIAFFANIVRVVALTLITYYFGDEAGQSFLHQGAGIVALLFSLTGLLLWDAWLAHALRRPWCA